MAISERQWQTIERRSGVPRHVMQVLLGRGERSSQSSVSPKGAYGRAQLMPATARALEKQYGISTKGEFGNILGGALYLGQQKRAFGSWKLAFAAYNAGGGAVRKYGGVPPYKETQDYVQRTMSALGDPGGAQTSLIPHRAPTGTSQPFGGGQKQLGIQSLQAMAQGEKPMNAFTEIAQQMVKQNRSVFGGNNSMPRVPIAPGMDAQIQGHATPHDLSAINLAKQYLGTPYSWGGGGPSGPTKGIGRGAGTVGFDCSGLIEYVWAKQGINVGSTTYTQIKNGRAVRPNAKSLRPGDAVFFGDPRSPHHVGMYIGGGKFIESPHTGATVRISKLAGRNPSAARRYG